MVKYLKRMKITWRRGVVPQSLRKVTGLEVSVLGIGLMGIMNIALSQFIMDKICVGGVMNLKEVTKVLKERILTDLDTDKYEIKLEEYSWCVDVIICNLNHVHLQSFLIRRFNDAGDFGIGIPNYDRAEYLVKGNLSGNLDKLVEEFSFKFNQHQNYEVTRKSEKICELKDIMFKGVTYG